MPHLLFSSYLDAIAPNPANTAGLTSIAITRNASQASSKGRGDYFTGSVRIDTLFKTTAPARTSGGRVIRRRFDGSSTRPTPSNR